MKFEEGDVKRLSRRSTYTLQHVPTGIVCTGEGVGVFGYWVAMGKLRDSVNAYYTACDYVNRVWVAPGIERVYGGARGGKKADTIAFDEMADYCRTDVTVVGDIFNNIKTFEAEHWLNEQPDHSAISKGPVPIDPVWEMLKGFRVESALWTPVIDFDALRRHLCSRYHVNPY